jgi:alanine dehydrogenase
MIIGVPREIKKEEYRVGITPEGAGKLIEEGHRVLVEAGAGEGSGFSDREYLEKGAEVVEHRPLFEEAEMIVKVKEPLPEEYALLREGQVLFTYLHLAANPELTEALLKKRVTALGYETLQKDGALPLLAPMSEIAGRMAPLMGAYYLQRVRGGRGILPTGATGADPARTVILGAGTVGASATKVSVGLGMETVVLNRGKERLERIKETYGEKVRTRTLTPEAVAEEIRDADILIGAILVPGGRTPVLVTKEMLRTMKKGAVIVDVSVDQGGCVETARPTTHDDPVYEVEGVIHYTVANMPGAYPRTYTQALTAATLPYIKTIAARGIVEAIKDPVIKTAVNTYKGKLVHPALMEPGG